MHTLQLINDSLNSFPFKLKSLTRSFCIVSLISIVESIVVHITEAILFAEDVTEF